MREELIQSSLKKLKDNWKPGKRRATVKEVGNELTDDELRELQRRINVPMEDFRGRVRRIMVKGGDPWYRRMWQWLPLCCRPRLYSQYYQTQENIYRAMYDLIENYKSGKLS